MQSVATAEKRTINTEELNGNRVGVHYLGDCGEKGMLPRILRHLELEQEFVPMDEDGFDTLFFQILNSWFRPT